MAGLARRESLQLQQRKNVLEEPSDVISENNSETAISPCICQTHFALDVDTTCSHLLELLLLRAVDIPVAVTSLQLRLLLCSTKMFGNLFARPSGLRGKGSVHPPRRGCGFLLG